MLFKSGAIEQILSGKVTMVARASNYKCSMRYLLGCDSKIHAIARLKKSMTIDNERRWQRLREYHKCSENLPYPKTHLFCIKITKAIRPSLRFRHPRGAISIVLYQP